MLRRLCYFNIFFPAVYFFIYFKDTIDYIVAGQIIVVILFSGLLLKQEEAQTFRNNIYLKITAVLMGLTLVARIIALYKLIVLIDVEYLEFRIGSFIVLSFLFCAALILQLFLYLKRISVL